MAKNYEDMTIAELDKANSDLQSKKESIHCELREIARARDFKLAEKKVESMTDTEKKAIAKVLSPQTIGSKSKAEEPEVK